MSPIVKADLCVIGGGSGGLSVAAGAAQLGASTVLIERGPMGGDCLNYGCVPSKTLLAAAKAASNALTVDKFGIAGAAPRIDAARLHDHIQAVIGAIAPHDSVERFTGLGVRVIRATAHFTGPTEAAAGEVTIHARRFVIATGSRPTVPAIPGLAATPFLSNETLFALRVLPQHLIVIGGGAIGVEMAQAYRRLGAHVTLLEAATLLARDDPDLVAVLRRQLCADGVELIEGARVLHVEGGQDTVAVVIAGDDDAVPQRRIEGSHLLLAAGRQPNIHGLDLAIAGIATTAAGICVDARLRTSNRRVFAIGDVIAGGDRFTHAAAYHAAIVLKNILFRWPAKVDHRVMPRVTFGDPELAQVGLTEADVTASGRAFRVLQSRYADNDRARAECLTDGLVKIVVSPTGQILGAGIVGAHAGELIQTWVLAMSRRLKIGALATTIAPYPTFGEINKQAAASFFTDRLFSPATKRLVRLLARFG